MLSTPQAPIYPTSVPDVDHQSSREEHATPKRKRSPPTQDADATPTQQRILVKDIDVDAMHVDPQSPPLARPVQKKHKGKARVTSRSTVSSSDNSEPLAIKPLVKGKSSKATTTTTTNTKSSRDEDLPPFVEFFDNDRCSHRRAAQEPCS